MARRSQQRRSRREAAAYVVRWTAYLEARARAERSGDIADGIAAGRAWVEFMKLFAPLPSPQGGAADRYNNAA